MTDTKEKQRKPRRPKKITAKYLDNVAAYYLGRYASSSANLRRILMRRAVKSCEYHNTPIEQAEKLIGELLKKYQDLGFLDDRKYAFNLAKQLREKGKSKKQILAKMYEKQVPDYLSFEAIDVVDSNANSNAELEAAWLLARKRKIGPFRNANVRQEFWKKDLGILARAGFSYDIAQTILETDSILET